MRRVELEKRIEERERERDKKEEKQRMGRHFVCRRSQGPRVPRTKVFSRFFWFWKPNWKELSCRVTPL